MEREGSEGSASEEVLDMSAWKTAPENFVKGVQAMRCSDETSRRYAAGATPMGVCYPRCTVTSRAS